MYEPLQIEERKKKKKKKNFRAGGHKNVKRSRARASIVPFILLCTRLEREKKRTYNFYEFILLSLRSFKYGNIFLWNVLPERKIKT